MPENLLTDLKVRSAKSTDRDWKLSDGGGLFLLCFMRLSETPSPWEGTEKLKPTIKLKVDDGEIAVLPFIICLF